MPNLSDNCLCACSWSFCGVPGTLGNGLSGSLILSFSTLASLATAPRRQSIFSPTLFPKLQPPPFLPSIPRMSDSRDLEKSLNCTLPWASPDLPSGLAYQCLAYMNECLCVCVCMCMAGREVFCSYQASLDLTLALGIPKRKARP